MTVTLWVGLDPIEYDLLFIRFDCLTLSMSFVSNGELIRILVYNLLESFVVGSFGPLLGNEAEGFV